MGSAPAAPPAVAGSADRQSTTGSAAAGRADFQSATGSAAARSADFQSATGSADFQSASAPDAPPPDAPPDLDALAACDEVDQRVVKLFEWRVPSDSILDIALDHLTLARAALWRWLLTGAVATPAPARDPDQPPDAHTTALTAAVTGLRDAGTMDYLPKALLTAALSHALRGDPAAARALLDEAWGIAEGGPMPLFKADVLLTDARLWLARPWAAPSAAAIDALVDTGPDATNASSVDQRSASTTGAPNTNDVRRVDQRSASTSTTTETTIGATNTNDRQSATAPVAAARPTPAPTADTVSRALSTLPVLPRLEAAATGEAAATYPWPERTPAIDLAEARRLIEHLGYARRLPELADAEAALRAVGA